MKEGHSILEDFPILKQKVHGKPLVYLDNAATSQKPQVVIDAVSRYYREENSNIHRGVHSLSERATQRYEEVRHRVRDFIHAKESREILFVRGTTEAINLVAQTYGRTHVHAGDEIVISAMEHHSNIVPWQILCEEKRARLRVAPINDDGELIFEEFQKLLSDRTKLVSIVHASNVLGTINPVKKIVESAHQHHIPVLLDGAQAAPHLPIDVQELDCDFYTFSGHKMYGPTGIGVLYGKGEILEEIPPYQSGGDMIRSVTFEKTTYNKIPYKFEAGTPNVAGVVGLGAAIDYIDRIGLNQIAAHEKKLLEEATEKIVEVPGIRLIGTAREKTAILNFVMEGVHPHDIGTIVDQEGVAIRTGHHCAMPLMLRYGVPATARASFALYNTQEDIDILVKALQKVKEVFG